MAKKPKKFIPKRRDQTIDNQWLQKDLFKELPFGTVTPESQLYMLQRNERGDGVLFIPIRVTVEDILALNVAVHDEGSAGTVYLPSECFDELNASAVYTIEETQNEGESDSIY